jgi:hypothetical protein
LQLAVPVRDADTAYVIAFGKEHLENHSAIALKTRTRRTDLHALADHGGAGCQEFVHSLYFHQTHAAPPVNREAGHLAKARDAEVVLTRDFEDGLIIAGADVPAIDL